MNKYIKHTQKNGLRVILVPDNSKNVVTTMVIVGTGSRYESEEFAGISHVLEHMFYKGTKKRPSSAAISTFIEEIGGEFNAFTSKEYTGFYTKVAAKHLPKSIDFLSDLLINPLFDQKELEKEKQVILQEYDMYQDLPMEIASSRFEEALFGKNSLGRDVIGYRDSIKKISRQDLFDYKEQHYQLGNIIVVVAGNIDSIAQSELFQRLKKASLLSRVKVKLSTKFFCQKISNWR
jgi:predicted Zn-dependent peptidase